MENLMRNVLSAVMSIAMSLELSGICLAQELAEIGMLDCVIEGEAALVINDAEGLVCTFVPASGELSDTYFGGVRQFAPNMAITDRMALRWTMLAASPDAFSSGALEGAYVAAPPQTAGSSLGSGALMGGFQNTFVLRPVAVPAELGINVAPEITSFRLRSVRA
jgi:hypothetical protein